MYLCAYSLGLWDNLSILIHPGYDIMYHTNILSKYGLIYPYSLGLWDNVSHQHLVEIWIDLFLFIWVMG